MRNIFLLLILATFSVFSQNNPAKFKNGVETRFVSIDTLTTTERDALTVVATKGTIIFNATTEQYEGYNPITSSWGALGGGFDETANYSPSGFWNFTGNMQSTGNVDFLGTFEWHNNNFRATMPNLTQNDTIAVKSELSNYLMSADLSNYAEKDGNNTFTGLNTFTPTGTNQVTIDGSGLDANYSGLFINGGDNKPLYTVSTGSVPNTFYQNSTDAGSLINLLTLGRVTTNATSSDGIAGAITFMIDGTDGFGADNIVTTTRLISSLENATFGQTRSAFAINNLVQPLVGGATSKDVLKINGYGKINFGIYGNGQFTGTPTYNLSVDANGNVIETANSEGITAGKIGDTPVAVTQLQFQGDDVTFAEENGEAVVSFDSSPQYTSISANYSLLPDDDFIKVDNSGTLTVTINAASSTGLSENKLFTFTFSGAGTVTFDFSGVTGTDFTTYLNTTSVTLEYIQATDEWEVINRPIEHEDSWDVVFYNQATEPTHTTTKLSDTADFEANVPMMLNRITLNGTNYHFWIKL
jgi:hypothetical protein